MKSPTPIPNPQSPIPILLIGCGRMGSSLYKGWLRSGMNPRSITIIDPSNPLVESTVYSSLSALPKDYTAGIIVFAVKPQMIEAVLATAKHLKPALILSILAGTRIHAYEKTYGASTPIVRAMPNTPALIGESISALVANHAANDALKSYAADLLRAVGQIVWLENEDQLDAATALSGSGPAYIFLFLEALIDGAVGLGLPKDVATQLAYQTVLGSATLAKSSLLSLAQLRADVTSPGGTTEAALGVFEHNHGFKNLVKQAMEAAVKRAKELS